MIGDEQRPVVLERTLVGDGRVPPDVHPRQPEAKRDKAAQQTDDDPLERLLAGIVEEAGVGRSPERNGGSERCSWRRTVCDAQDFLGDLRIIFLLRHSGEDVLQRARRDGALKLLDGIFGDDPAAVQNPTREQTRSTTSKRCELKRIIRPLRTNRRRSV